MSSRQLRNIVQEAFDIAYEKMLSEGHQNQKHFNLQPLIGSDTQVPQKIFQVDL